MLRSRGTLVRFDGIHAGSAGFGCADDGASADFGGGGGDVRDSEGHEVAGVEVLGYSTCALGGPRLHGSHGRGYLPFPVGAQLDEVHRTSELVPY
mmetsp:Transcript_19206/g.47469  ORF Transcript_19206/g.47469 Transcript_19206/m.47469 type:complete len:95 (+) Transcript_19206:649-933(+)